MGDSETIQLTPEKKPSVRHRLSESFNKLRPAKRDDQGGQDTETPPEGETTPSERGPVELKKRVGLFSGTALIVGTMIGSGIFASPTGVLEYSGSVGVSILVWLACGMLALTGGLCYVELGTSVPKSGAEYAYLLEAFGSIPAYMFNWVSIMILKPASLAIISIIFSEYAVAPMFSGEHCAEPEWAKKLIAIALIWLITAINGTSVEWATRVQNIFTVAKLTAVAMIILIGIVRLAQGHTANLSNAFEGTTTSASGIGLAFYQGLWAYDGWNNLNYVTEELQNPNRNLPLAIFLALPIVTACYILIIIAYLTVMTPAEMLASNAVAQVLGDRVLTSKFSWVIPLCVCLSTFGAANGSCFSAGRLPFVAGRQGHVVKVLSYVQVHYMTPLPSLVFQGIMATLMTIPSNFDTLVNYFSFAAWVFYGLAVTAVVVLRIRQPDLKRPFKIFLGFPILFVLVSIYIVIAPIIDYPEVEYIYATVFIVGGLLLYIPFVHFKISFKIMDYITVFIQKSMNVAPPDEEPID